MGGKALGEEKKKVPPKVKLLLNGGVDEKDALACGISAVGYNAPYRANNINSYSLNLQSFTPCTGKMSRPFPALAWMSSSREPRTE